MIGSWLGRDRGSVSAEFAIAMTAVALMVLFAVGALGAASRHVQLQDAVSDAARLAARGESQGRVFGAVHAVIPDANAGRADVDGLVCVTARAPGFLGVPITARGCALPGGW